MKPAPVYVSAAGMACPVGLTWASACAAMRAGITRKWISSYRDNQGREIVVSYLRDHIPETASCEERWLFLLAYALEDLSRTAGLQALERMPFFLALPLDSRGRPVPTALVRDALATRLGLRIPLENLHILVEGTCGGLASLDSGRASARAGRPCVVAAADSLLSARRLLALSGRDRLRVDGNSDGVTPGEAAGAVILTADRQHALANIRGLGLAKEMALLDNDVPLRAEGLIAAARAALLDAGLEMHELDFRISDAAGESFYFKEQALLVSRLLRQPKAQFPLWLPADCLGHTGASAGLSGVLWAMAAWARHYAPGKRAMVCAGSDDGARSAVVLEGMS